MLNVKRTLVTTMIVAVIGLGVFKTASCVNIQPESVEAVELLADETVEPMDVDVEPVTVELVVEEPVEEVVEVEPELALSEEDIQLIAWVTMAEAEGEPVEGKRLVIDTLLNRIEDDSFPDSAHGVVYQKNQFEAMWNGRSNRCYATDEVIQLVKEELIDRTDSRVLWFRSGRYHTFGTPVRSVGNHYFSTH